jgi:hypothetical protein
MMIYHIDDCEVHAGDASCPSRLECHLAEINSLIQDILATLCIKVTTDFGAYSQIGFQDTEADVLCFQKKKQPPLSFISANQIVVCPMWYTRFFLKCAQCGGTARHRYRRSMSIMVCITCFPRTLCLRPHVRNVMPPERGRSRLPRQTSLAAPPPNLSHRLYPSTRRGPKIHLFAGGRRSFSPPEVAILMRSPLHSLMRRVPFDG